MSWPWVIAIVIALLLAVVEFIWLLALTDEVMTLKETSASADGRHDRELQRLQNSNYHLAAQVTSLIPLITSEVDEETDEAVATLKAIAAELES